MADNKKTVLVKVTSKGLKETVADLKELNKAAGKKNRKVKLSVDRPSFQRSVSRAFASLGAGGSKSLKIKAVIDKKYFKNSIMQQIKLIEAKGIRLNARLTGRDSRESSRSYKDSARSPGIGSVLQAGTTKAIGAHESKFESQFTDMARVFKSQKDIAVRSNAQMNLLNKNLERLITTIGRTMKKGSKARLATMQEVKRARASRGEIHAGELRVVRGESLNEKEHNRYRAAVASGRTVEEKRSAGQAALSGIKQDRNSRNTSKYNKGEKGLAGVSGAAGRDFGKMASGMGGFVAMYADYAAKVFALGAAFRGLREAANLVQMKKGMAEYGKTTGLSLSIVAKQLQRATDMAVTYKEAADTATLASAAGFGSDDIIKMGKAAKVAALALGRNVPDALDRMTRGVVKAEPELLDELGIILRLKDAQEAWAESNDKSVSSMTTFEKQMAIMEFATGQALDKFGHLNDTMDPNQWDVLSSKVTDMALNVGGAFNSILSPALDIVAKSPIAMMTSFGLLISYLGNKVVPSIGNLSKEWKSKAEQMSINTDEVEQSVIASRKAGYISKGKARKLYSSAVAKSASGSVLKDYYSEISKGSGVFKSFIRGVKNINKQMDILHTTQMHGITIWKRWATTISTSVVLAVRTLTTALNTLVTTALKVISVAGTLQIVGDVFLKITGLSTQNASEVDEAFKTLQNTFTDTNQKYRAYMQTLQSSDGSLNSVALAAEHTANRTSNLAASFEEFTAKQGIFIDNSSELDKSINEMWGNMGSSVLEDSQEAFVSLGESLHTSGLEWESLGLTEERVKQITESETATLRELRKVTEIASAGLMKVSKSQKLLAGNTRGAVDSSKAFNKEYKTFEEGFKNVSIFDGMIEALENFNNSLEAIKVKPEDDWLGRTNAFKNAEQQYKTLIEMGKKLNAPLVDPRTKARTFDKEEWQEGPLTEVNKLLAKQKGYNLKALLDARAIELSLANQTRLAKRLARNKKEIGLLNGAAASHNTAVSKELEHHNQMLENRRAILAALTSVDEDKQDAKKIRSTQAAILGLETKIFKIRESYQNVNVENLKILTKLKNQELEGNRALLGLRTQIESLATSINIEQVLANNLLVQQATHQEKLNNLQLKYQTNLSLEKGDTSYITEEYNRQVELQTAKNTLQEKYLDIQSEIVKDARRQAINTRKIEYVDAALNKQEELRSRTESLIELEANASGNRIKADTTLELQQIARLREVYEAEKVRVALSEKTAEERQQEAVHLRTIYNLDVAILQEENRINKVLENRQRMYDAQISTTEAYLSLVESQRDTKSQLFKEENLVQARSLKFLAAEQSRERDRSKLLKERGQYNSDDLEYRIKTLELMGLEYQKQEELRDLQQSFYEDQEAAHKRRMKNGNEWAKTVRDEWFYTIKEMEDSMSSFAEFMVQASVDSFRTVNQKAMENWEEHGTIWAADLVDTMWGSLGDSLIQQGQDLMVLGQSQIMAGFANEGGKTPEQEARISAELAKAQAEKSLNAVLDNTVELSASVQAMKTLGTSLKDLDSLAIANSITDLKTTIADTLVGKLDDLIGALQTFWQDYNPRTPGAPDTPTYNPWAGVNRATGGSITGPGGPKEDKIPAMLSNGEYVINAASTGKHRALIEAINEDKLPGFAKGGSLGAQTPAQTPTPIPAKYAKYLDGSSTFKVHGSINKDMKEAWDYGLDNFSTDRVDIDSTGGNIIYATNIINDIAAHAMDTHLNGLAASGAGWMWLAGKNRTFNKNPTPKLKLHGGSHRDYDTGAELANTSTAKIFYQLDSIIKHSRDLDEALANAGIFKNLRNFAGTKFGPKSTIDYIGAKQVAYISQAQEANQDFSLLSTDKLGQKAYMAHLLKTLGNRTDAQELFDKHGSILNGETKKILYNFNPTMFKEKPKEQGILDSLLNFAGGFSNGGLASLGRNGDSELAHINKDEQALLKSLGGSGTINPNTGLPEFFGFDWFSSDKPKKRDDSSLQEKILEELGKLNEGDDSKAETLVRISRASSQLLEETKVVKEEDTSWKEMISEGVSATEVWIPKATNLISEVATSTINSASDIGDAVGLKMLELAQTAKSSIEDRISTDTSSYDHNNLAEDIYSTIIQAYEYVKYKIWTCDEDKFNASMGITTKDMGGLLPDASSQDKLAEAGLKKGSIYVHDENIQGVIEEQVGNLYNTFRNIRDIIENSPEGSEAAKGWLEEKGNLSAAYLKSLDTLNNKHVNELDIWYNKFDNTFRERGGAVVTGLEEGQKADVVSKDNLAEVYKINNSTLGSTLNSWGMSAEGVFNVGAASLAQGIGMALKTGTFDFKQILANFTLSMANTLIDSLAQSAANSLMSSMFGEATEGLIVDQAKNAADIATATTVVGIKTVATTTNTALEVGAATTSAGIITTAANFFASSMVAAATAAAGIITAANATSSIGSTMLFAANGGVLEGGFRAFANGGTVTKPTLGLVGEGRYNEAVVPLPDGRSIPVIGNTGGGNINNIVINVNVDDKGNASTQTENSGGLDDSTGEELGYLISQAVQTEIVEQQRPGGLLSSY